MAITSIIIRSVLLILSFISFFPQYRRLLFKGNCNGISFYYIPFNLISATEQFTLGLRILLNSKEIFDSVINNSSTAGDWLNFAELALVLLCHLALFFLYLDYAPPLPGRKSIAVAIYIAFLLISIVPAIFESTLPPPGDEGRDWFSALFGGMHALYINPIITALAIAALFPQARETLSRPDRGALSLTGLAVQAVVFALVAACWPFRMTLPSSFWHSKPFGWYQSIGWATVDNAVYAVVQTVLLLIVVRRGREVQEVVVSGEREPLLES